MFLFLLVELLNEDMVNVCIFSNSCLDNLSIKSQSGWQIFNYMTWSKLKCIPLHFASVTCADIPYGTSYFSHSHDFGCTIAVENPKCTQTL